VISDRDCTGLTAAKHRGIEAEVVNFKDFETRELWSAALRDAVNAWDPDLVVAAGFMRITSPVFVDAFAGRHINLHPALLPAFPGAHGVRDALEFGARVTGCTVHFVDREVDHGPILVQEPVRILPGDTEASLHERIKRVEHRLLPTACRLFLEGKVRIDGHTTLVDGPNPPMPEVPLSDGVVKLRPPVIGDIPGLVAQLQEPSVSRFTRIPYPYTDADGRWWVQASAIWWLDQHEASFVMLDADADRVIGGISMKTIDDPMGTAEVGYWVAASERGRGVASRAVRLLSEWSFRHLGIKRIELLTDLTNEASQRVAIKAGFTKEAVLRSACENASGRADMVLFSLLPTDLEPPLQVGETA
jgi:phosphoribosylglycinamide formyltransferase-1